MGAKIMSQGDDPRRNRTEPAPAVDSPPSDAPGSTRNVVTMDDVDRDARDTKPLRAPQPDDRDTTPLQSEDGDMFLHSENDTDF
jgi:hypothetical protein